MNSPSHLPLPLTVETITREWLTAALQTRAPGVVVNDFSVVDVVHSTTTKARLNLQLNEAGQLAGIPERVIVKGGFQPHSRELEKMHLREVRGYRDVFPQVPLHAPACYFADFDAERRQGIIIMEDLVARGVTFCHATKPQSYEQAKKRLEALARFHGATWNSAELQGDGQWADLVDFFQVMRNFFDKYTSAEHWQRFMNMPRGVATSFRFRDREWMRNSWEKVCRYGAQLPQCVLHGDVHLGNLYIEADGTPGFFDTLASKGPGMLEVSYFISASVDSSDRPHWEEDLVQCYLDTLVQCGVQAPDFDDAMQQYRLLLLYGLFIWQTTESHYQSELVNTANAARVSAAMVDHNVYDLLERL